MSIILYSLVILFLLVFPADTAAFASHALRVWGENIVPILFPYMYFSRRLFRRLLRRQMPIVPTAALLALLGGSPSGAVILSSSSHRLSQRNLHALCMLCGTISPMFILGPLKLWTGDAVLCCQLLFTHWTSTILCARVIWLFEKNCRENTCIPNSFVQQNHAGELNQSIDAILQVGGCVICYSVLAGLFSRMLPASCALSSLIHACFEISGGTHAIWNSPFPANTKSILLAASLGFSGISILAQNHAFLGPLGITMRWLVWLACLRACCSAICMACLLTII